jgi:resuscitation-promoting factor RpfA
VHPAPRLAEAHAADPIEADDDAMAKPSARRDLLPDVEEINSTLRPSEQPGDDAAPMTGEPVVEGRSSFRSGFLVVMTIAILGAALYIAAPMLRDAVPALAGFLDAYIGFVDGLRLQLDGLMQSATMAMGGASG